MVIRTNSRIAEIAVYLVALVVIILMMGALAPQAAEPTKTVNNFRKDVLKNDDMSNFVITFDNNEIINTRHTDGNHWDELKFYMSTEKLYK